MHFFSPHNNFSISFPRIFSSVYSSVILSSSFSLGKHTVPFLNLFLRRTNWALRNDDVWRSGCIDPSFLDLDTSQRLVVSFTLRPIYPHVERSRYPLDRSLGGPHIRSGPCRKKNILDATGIRSPTSQFPKTSCHFKNGSLYTIFF
jgi:hypothetical protein